MFENKHLFKDAEEKGKEVWKRRCEEAKQEKKNKCPKYTARRKLFTRKEENECNALCNILKRIIAHGNGLCCDNRQNF